MAELIGSVALPRDQLNEMLASSDLRARVKALGHILDGDQPINDFITQIEALQDSKAPSVSGMTEGDIASLVLAVKASRPYTGNNVIAQRQIEILTDKT